jgi:2-polyprenyl-3-methyl-5-hydroxy-6-metoxy-1,4-benzoquinol methylase
MDDYQAGRYWEGNALAWTRLSRQGWDVYRDAVNTPAFLELLPDVTGKTGLDVGCGEGHNTHLFAGRGARMFAIDVAPTFVRLASEMETRQGDAIRYAVASALALPFAPGQFDFATAVMTLMDLPRSSTGPERNLSRSARRRLPSVFDTASLLFSASPLSFAHTRR